MTKPKMISVQITNEERLSRGMDTCNEWPTIGAVFNEFALLIDQDSVFIATLCITPNQEETFTAFAAEKGYTVKPDIMAAFSQPS